MKPVIALFALLALSSIFPDAKAQYVAELAARARHHSAKARQFVLSQGEIVAADAAGSAGQELRDFFHDAYYAIFYVARVALVSIGSFDCSFHAEIDAVLLREITVRRPDKENEASGLAKDLKIWREAREVGDYIMSRKRLEALASGVNLTSVKQSLESISLRGA